ncbi:MAG: hypothetical protein ORO03_10460, partial [Alphaproteobacteria bacterium]|nr:hypothetical protein [Alphaproteobacteria bacterium]
MGWGSGAHRGPLDFHGFDAVNAYPIPHFTPVRTERLSDGLVDRLQIHYGLNAGFAVYDSNVAVLVRYTWDGQIFDCGLDPLLDDFCVSHFRFSLGCDLALLLDLGLYYITLERDFSAIEKYFVGVFPYTFLKTKVLHFPPFENKSI